MGPTMWPKLKAAHSKFLVNLRLPIYFENYESIAGYTLWTLFNGNL